MSSKIIPSGPVADPKEATEGNWGASPVWLDGEAVSVCGGCPQLRHALILWSPKDSSVRRFYKMFVSFVVCLFKFLYTVLAVWCVCTVSIWHGVPCDFFRHVPYTMFALVYFAS